MPEPVKKFGVINRDEVVKVAPILQTHGGAKEADRLFGVQVCPWKGDWYVTELQKAGDKFQNLVVPRDEEVDADDLNIMSRDVDNRLLMMGGKQKGKDVLININAEYGDRKGKWNEVSKLRDVKEGESFVLTFKAKSLSTNIIGDDITNVKRVGFSQNSKNIYPRHVITKDETLYRYDKIAAETYSKVYKNRRECGLQENFVDYHNIDEYSYLYVSLDGRTFTTKLHGAGSLSIDLPKDKFKAGERIKLQVLCGFEKFKRRNSYLEVNR